MWVMTHLSARVLRSKKEQVLCVDDGFALPPLRK